MLTANIRPCPDKTNIPWTCIAQALVAMSDQESSGHPTSPDWSPSPERIGSPEVPSEVAEGRLRSRSRTPQRGLQAALLRQEAEQAADAEAEHHQPPLAANRPEMERRWHGQWSSWSWWESWPWQQWWSSAAAEARRGQDTSRHQSEGEDWQWTRRGAIRAWQSGDWHARADRPQTTWQPVQQARAEEDESEGTAGPDGQEEQTWTAIELRERESGGVRLEEAPLRLIPS